MLLNGSQENFTSCSVRSPFKKDRKLVVSIFSFLSKMAYNDGADRAGGVIRWS